MKIRFAKRQFMDIFLVACAFSYPLTSLFSGFASNLKFFSAISLIALGIYSFFKTGRATRAAITFVLFFTIAFFLVAVSLSWSVSLQEKIKTFLGVITIFGIVTSFILLRDRYSSITDQAFVLIGLIAIITFFSSPTAYQEARVSFNNNNPIWMARVLGLAAIGSVHLLVSRKYNPLLLITIIFISLYAIVATGSRGPLIAVMAVVIAAAFFSPYRRKLVSIVTLGFFFVTAFIFVKYLGFFSGARGLSFSSEDTGTVSIRQEIYEYTLNLIFQNPAGIGIGQFYYLWQPYPHNIFLEFIVEWGWLSGGFMSYLIIFTGYKLFTMRKTYLFIFLVYIYELVNALFSGDITSPRFLYAVIFFALIKALEDTFRTFKFSIRSRSYS